MKKYTAITVILFLSTALFSEITAWKGMEFGKEQNPEWLYTLVQKNNDKLLRKKFSIDASYQIFFGTGTEKTPEAARNAAYSDCLNKILAENKNKNAILNSMTPVYEYWELDDKKLYTVYTIYSMQNKK